MEPFIPEVVLEPVDWLPLWDDWVWPVEVLLELLDWPVIIPPARARQRRMY